MDVAELKRIYEMLCMYVCGSGYGLVSCRLFDTGILYSEDDAKIEITLFSDANVNTEKLIAELNNCCSSDINWADVINGKCKVNGTITVEE